MLDYEDIELFFLIQIKMFLEVIFIIILGLVVKLFYNSVQDFIESLNIKYVEIDTSKIQNKYNFNYELLTKINNKYYIMFDIRDVLRLKYKRINSIIEFHSDNGLLLLKLNLMKRYNNEYYNNLITTLKEKNNIDSNLNDVYLIYTEHH